MPDQVIKDLEQDSRVRMLGLVPTAGPYYTAMDLLVLPTYREGFPNVLLEAGAMELPVVATQVPGCVDAVDNGVTGTLVPARNEESLALAIEAYLSSRSLRRMHGRSGRKRVMNLFSQETIWRALSGRYDALRARGDLPGAE